MVMHVVLAVLHLVAGVSALGVLLGVFYAIVIGAASASLLSYCIVQGSEDADGEHVIAHGLFLVTVFTSSTLLLDAVF